METNETTISFLLFSCLSISIETLRDNDADVILESVIKRAYRDASSHVLSVEKGDPRTNDSVDKNPDSIIAASVNNLTQKQAKDYDEWHCNLCKCLIDSYIGCSYNRDKQGNHLNFRFGIAQKWVNMTMKYMDLLCDLCIVCGLQNSKFYQAYGEMVNSCKESFHAPVDRYIINAAWKYPKVYLPLKVDNEKRNNEYANPSDYVMAWSKWECRDYCQFQRSLREVVRNNHQKVLSWEKDVWIFEAEKKGNGKSKRE